MLEIKLTKVSRYLNSNAKTIEASGQLLASSKKPFLFILFLAGLFYIFYIDNHVSNLLNWLKALSVIHTRQIIFKI